MSDQQIVVELLNQCHKKMNAIEKQPALSDRDRGQSRPIKTLAATYSDYDAETEQQLNTIKPILLLQAEISVHGELHRCHSRLVKASGATQTHYSFLYQYASDFAGRYRFPAPDEA